MARSSSSKAKGKRAPDRIPYKHISYRKTKRQAGFIVQHGGRTHGGFHSTLKDACATLKDVLSKLKPPVTVLPKKDVTPVESKSAAKAYYGVSYHKGLQRWVGNSESLGGTFPTARLCHLALVKKKPSARSCEAKTRAKVAVSDLAERTKNLMLCPLNAIFVFI